MLLGEYEADVTRPDTPGEHPCIIKDKKQEDSRKEPAGVSVLDATVEDMPVEVLITDGDKDESSAKHQSGQFQVSTYLLVIPQLLQQPVLQLLCLLV